MSLRLFVYWCALCGAWAALAGWAAGRVASGEHPVASAAFKALFLGMLVALALSLLDVLWSYSLRQVRQVVPRVLTSTAGGAAGGLVGGFAGQLLYGLVPHAAFFILGWAITGFLIGASLVFFDLLARYVQRRSLRGGVRKTMQATLGGTVGGILGGFLSLRLKDAAGGLFPDVPVEDLWSPSALGFVVLGLCIGLMIGLAQVLFKESWIRFEAGRRRGREMILTRPQMTIGRAESCDIGLFGDGAVEKLHARLDRLADGYVLTDAGSGSGTFVNGQRIQAPTLLRSGDRIGVGDAVLRFEERQKRPPPDQHQPEAQARQISRAGTVES
jgi:hypothetical protein